MGRIDYKGKRIWITGASSGIGEELAIQLNALGAFTILSARRTDKLEEVKNRCAFPDNTLLIPLDLTDESSINNAVNSVIQHGELDLVINNAGIAQKGLALENSMQVERMIMETNYFGTIALTKAILPHFLNQGHGWFAVVTSIAGIVGVPGRTAYAASKHALHGFFDSLRAEQYSCPIDVTIIMPGFINTSITIKELKGNGEEYGKVEKSHRLGLAADVCASKIIRKLAYKRKNIKVGGLEIFSLYLSRFAPNLYDFLIRNHPMKRWRIFMRYILFKKQQHSTKDH